MAFLRSAADQNLMRLLRARAEDDPAFRESLARVLTAEAKYEDYVHRKQQEGSPDWLSRDDWEVWVFGKESPSGKADQSDAPEPAEPPQDQKVPDAVKSRVKRMKKRLFTKDLRQVWERRNERGKRPKRLFSSEDTEGLPKWASQPQSNPERLMAQAKESVPLMLDWLNRGKGIDKDIGAQTVRRDEDPDAKIDFSQEGPVVVIAPPKTKKAAEDKVRERYGGDWSEGAVDLVRATIAVDKYEDLMEVVEKLKESGVELAAKPRNRYRDATSSGYRDVVLNARLPNGHVMELQLHLKPVLQAKESNHGLYSQIKGLDEKPSDELAEEQQRILDENTRRMREIYDRAWEEATARSEAASIFDEPSKLSRPSFKSKKGAEEGPLYFELDGLPVQWDRPKRPQIHGGKKVIPVDSLAVFAERSVPIGKDEFELLVRDRKKQRSGKEARSVRRSALKNLEFREALRRVARKGGRRDGGL